MVQDITEHKTMVQKCKESEQRYRSLFDTMESGVAVYKAIDDGEDFEILDVNNFAEKIENVKKEDIIGKKLTSVFPGVEKFGLLDVLRRVWKTGEPETHPASVYEDEQRQTLRENQVYKLSTGDIVAVYNTLSDEK